MVLHISPGQSPTRRLTFVLLKLVEVGRVNVHNLSSPPVDLTRDGSPEDLIEHGVSHVIIRSASLVIGYSKGVGVSPSPSPRHLLVRSLHHAAAMMTDSECSVVRDAKSFCDVYTSHCTRTLDE